MQRLLTLSSKNAIQLVIVLKLSTTAHHPNLHLQRGGRNNNLVTPTPCLSHCFMNISVSGSLFLTLSHQWGVSFPIPPQAKVVHTSALTGLLNSLGSLSSVIPYLFLQSPQWQSEARAIVLPHLAPQISNSLCSQERSFLCYFVRDSAFGLGHLAWSRCAMQLFPPVPARGRRLTWWLLPLSAYIPLFPLEIRAGRKAVWGVLCVLSQFWFGRLLAESLLFLSQEELVSSRHCFLTFWHPRFQSQGYSLLSYKIAFTLCQKKEKITWNLEVSRRAGRIFSVHCCSVGIDFLLCLSKD